jgi:hypothetical protein
LVSLGGDSFERGVEGVVSFFKLGDEKYYNLLLLYNNITNN